LPKPICYTAFSKQLQITNKYSNSMFLTCIMNDRLEYDRKVIAPDVVHLITTRRDVRPFLSVTTSIHFHTFQEEL